MRRIDYLWSWLLQTNNKQHHFICSGLLLCLSIMFYSFSHNVFVHFFLFLFLFFCFWPHVRLAGSYFSNQGLNPGQWKCQVLTNGLPGNCQVHSLMLLLNILYYCWYCKLGFPFIISFNWVLLIYVETIALYILILYFANFLNFLLFP